MEKFNKKTGEVEINGELKIPFKKEYWFGTPINDAGPDIEAIGEEDLDITDKEALKYFKDRLNAASKIPFDQSDANNINE